MINKYEKQETKSEMVEGKLEDVTSFKEVLKAEADYLHVCGHDTNPPTPCRRVKIK
jgi:hypothetical protein